MPSPRRAPRRDMLTPMGTARVEALFVKPAKGAAMATAGRLNLVEGLGVGGDSNADRRSARQVLVVSARAARSLGVTAGGLRENITVSGIDVDELPSGTELHFGSARLRVTYPCEPCALLRRYAGVEPHSAAGRRGVLGVVVSSGPVVAGDAVAVSPSRYPQLPSGRRDRVAWFVRRVPRGEVVTYGQLAKAVAAPPGGARGLPRLLARLADDGVPAHRVVPADLRGLGDAQRVLLADEGVDVQGGRPSGGWWALDALLYERPGGVRRAVTPVL